MKSKIKFIVIFIIIIMQINIINIYALTTEPYFNTYTGTDIDKFEQYVSDLETWLKGMTGEDGTYINPNEIGTHYKDYYDNFVSAIQLERTNSQLNSTKIDKYSSIIDQYKEVLSRFEEVLSSWEDADSSTLNMLGVSVETLKSIKSNIEQLKKKDIQELSNQLNEEKLTQMTKENITGAANEETRTKWDNAVKKAEKIIKEFETQEKINDFLEKNTDKKINEKCSEIKDVIDDLNNNTGWTTDFTETNKYIAKLVEIKDELKNTVSKKDQKEINEKAKEKIKEGSNKDDKTYQIPQLTTDKTDEEEKQSTADDVIASGNDFLNQGGTKVINNNVLQSISKSIYNILLSIAVAVMTIIGGIIGIQLMTASIEAKAKVKEYLVPYVVACVIIFGGFTIWKIVVTILQQTI